MSLSGQLTTLGRIVKKGPALSLTAMLSASVSIVGASDHNDHPTLLLQTGRARDADSVKFSPDSQRLASANGHVINVWDASTKDQLTARQLGWLSHFGSVEEGIAQYDLKRRPSWPKRT